MLKNNVQMHNATVPVAASSPSAKEDKQHKTKMTLAKMELSGRFPNRRGEDLSKLR